MKSNKIMETPIVTVLQGQLRGNTRTDHDGNKFFSFVGIPYAKPPVGELRFKAPLPAESWTGVRDATKEGEMCFSRNDITRSLAGSEDCLFLNIFTKELPQSSKTRKPVMVFLHGGGFVSGSSNTAIYGPDFFMTEDVVLVTLNYRLGLLGFLNVEDVSLDVPGNAGLKDQREALKWIQQNIAAFNGDPGNVTIFGESAGAASVHYLMLSQSCAGLFHRAIMQSGCALNHWAYGDRVAQKIASVLGHETANEKEALDVLKAAPVHKLYVAQEQCKDSSISSKRRFNGPVIEKPNPSAIITENPIDIICSGKYNKVPIMIGYNTREGMLLYVLKLISLSFKGILIEIAKFIITKLGISLPQEERKIEDAIPWQVNIEEGSPKSLMLVKKIEEMYFKGPNEADNKYLLSTDSSFASGILATVKNHIPTSQNPVYLYKMSVESRLNLLKNIAMLKNVPGVCHADDLGYLFKNLKTPEIKKGSLEDISFRRFIKLWTNFAKYGDPTPDQKELCVKWLPANEQLRFLDIGKDLEMFENPDAERMALWREIYQQHPSTERFL